MCVYVSLRVFTYYLHFLRLREKSLLIAAFLPFLFEIRVGDWLN